jgi:quinol monooxygenase YgiN
MGSMVIACYKPRPGKQEELAALVREHLAPLRAEGLVTDRAPIAMRAKDGTILEIFEWKSEEHVAAAHKNPVVQDLWKKFEAVCWYETPANVPELKNMFSHFEAL